MLRQLTIGRILSLPVPKRWLLLGAGLALLAGTAPAGLTAATAGTNQPATPAGIANSPIKHVIEIMIENHAPDR